MVPLAWRAGRSREKSSAHRAAPSIRGGEKASSSARVEVPSMGPLMVTARAPRRGSEPQRVPGRQVAEPAGHEGGAEAIAGARRIDLLDGIGGHVQARRRCRSSSRPVGTALEDDGPDAAGEYLLDRRRLGSPASVNEEQLLAARQEEVALPPAPDRARRADRAGRRISLRIFGIEGDRAAVGLDAPIAVPMSLADAVGEQRRAHDMQVIGAVDQRVGATASARSAPQALLRML